MILFPLTVKCNFFKYLQTQGTTPVFVRWLEFHVDKNNFGVPTQKVLAERCRYPPGCFTSIAQTCILQYWPIYYGFFGEKKSEKLKYLKNLMTHRKKFSGFVRETNEEENAKITALNFENCGRRQGLKNTRKSPFSMNKKFSMHFSKKNCCEKNLFILTGYTTCQSLGNIAS